MKAQLTKTIKNALPRPAKLLARKIVDNFPFSKERQMNKLKNKDYSQLPLLAGTEENIHRVKEAAVSVYSNSWNFQSDALRREVAKGFEICIQHLLKSHQTIDYLEIGSCQGLSMSLIAGLIRNANALGKLVSIDPYFKEGYYESKTQVQVNKKTREKAYQLYRQLSIEIQHIEDLSSVGLKKFVCGNQRFNLIYIDGSHEGMNPLRDLGLSLELISLNGIIMLDDHKTYEDVKVIKELCDRNYKKIDENWKVAAFEVHSNQLNRGMIQYDTI